MIKKRNKLVLLASICITVFLMMGFEAYASEISGEQTISQEEVQGGQTEHSDEITVMDENGNITLVGDTNGIIEDNGSNTKLKARVASPKVVNFNTKDGKTTSYTEYKTGASGYTNGDYGADAAYLGTEDGKVKFMLSGVVGLVEEKEVQVVDIGKVSQVSCYIVENGKLIHKIMINLTSSSYGSSLSQGSAPSYLAAGKKYFSYDGHYFYEDYGVMLDDYMNETRANSVNPSEPYYNYYQYLPLRSTSVYTGDQLKTIVDNRVDEKSKLKGIGNVVVSCQNTYGVNSLIIAGVAANESAWGMSKICQQKNNIFGLNAVDSSPGESANTYKSVQECVRQFAESYMSKKYLRPGYTYYHGGFLGNKASGINVSYASDPYWGEKAANMAWRFDSDGGNKDAKRYTIGIKDTVATTHSNVNVRNASSTSAVSLYKTGGWTNYAVLIQKNTAEKGFYRIQSDAVLNSERTAADVSTGNYNISNMYAYISTEYVKVVHKGSDVTGKLPNAGKVVWDEPEKPAEPAKPAEPEKPAEPVKTYTKYKTTTSVNYRTGAGTSYSKGGTLAKGKEIEVEDGYSKKANDLTWYRFKMNGKNYYIASKYVTKVVAKKTYTTYTVKSKVNYRTAAGLSKKLAGTLKKGAKIEVENGYSKKADGYTWYRFKSGSKTYYVVSKYLTKSSTAEKKTYTKYKVKSKVNYRSGAGTSKTIKGTLAKGKIIEVENGYSKKANGLTWYRFKSGSKTYYVASKYLTKVSETEKKTYTKYKVKSKVNYRSGAGTSKAVKGTLKKGKVIRVENGYSKKANGYTWYRFKLDGKNYYVVSKYLKKQ